MKAVARWAGELWGLFVEDASFTLGILVVLGVAAFGFPLVALPEAWRGPAFFALLVTVLLENVRRSARSALRREVHPSPKGE